MILIFLQIDRLIIGEAKLYFPTFTEKVLESWGHTQSLSKLIEFNYCRFSRS